MIGLDRFYCTIRVRIIQLPVSQAAPVQPSLQLHISGDVHVPSIHDIVQIAIIIYPLTINLQLYNNIPISQIGPVQPSLHVQLFGDKHVPCTHPGVQRAKVLLKSLEKTKNSKLRVSQVGPVQLLSHSHVSGDIQVPCTHGDEQMAKNIIVSSYE